MPIRPESSRKLLNFQELEGWGEDDLTAALSAFCSAKAVLDGPDWHRLFAGAAVADNARHFFETHFRPVLVTDHGASLFTGYYEPVIAGALRRTDQFRYPIHVPPPELVASRPWASRREIQSGGLLDGRGLEIAWLADPIEVFFLQVQGSGRIALPDGLLIRVGYAGRNGHPYRSIGQEMIRRGLVPAGVSAQGLKDWLYTHPEQIDEILSVNPSYVFFRILPGLADGEGPIGTLGCSLTPGRSLAVDAGIIPLGVPVWVEIAGDPPIRRLMVAQDTGSAIKGAQRGDLFFGTGAEAGAQAGRLKAPGRMVALLPRFLAATKTN